MTFSRTAMVLAAGASLLAACGPKGGENTAAASGQAASASAAAASAGDVTITADQIPVAKAGLWEMTTRMNDGPPSISRHCETGQPMDLSKMKQTCAKVTLTRTALGGYVIDASCASAGGTSTMHTTMFGDPPNGSYSIDGVVTMTAPGRQPLKNVNHTIAKYLGPCPASQGAGG